MKNIYEDKDVKIVSGVEDAEHILSLIRGRRNNDSGKIIIRAEKKETGNVIFKCRSVLFSPKMVHNIFPDMPGNLIKTDGEWLLDDKASFWFNLKYEV